MPQTADTPSAATPIALVAAPVRSARKKLASGALGAELLRIADAAAAMHMAQNVRDELLAAQTCVPPTVALHDRCPPGSCAPTAQSSGRWHGQHPAEPAA